MNRRASGWGRIVLPLIFGLAGAAILIGLGTWQVQRLAWKQGVLAEIGARILDAPVTLPAAPDPAADRYLSVAVEGRLTGEGLEVLVSRKRIGPGYRVIAVLETGPEAGGGRRILIDRGFLPEAAR
ncbi:MAG: SURF1 family protein, partial [Gemmobacter sp.]